MDALPLDYVLIAESRTRGRDGIWKFALTSTDGQQRMMAADWERDIPLQRLELLAVVRGLEAVPEPAGVVLLTESRYVRHGLKFGLAEWRENGFRWERFGEMAPVRNSDLWQSIDRALEFHRVECRQYRRDSAHAMSGPFASCMWSRANRETKSARPDCLDDVGLAPSGGILRASLGRRLRRRLTDSLRWMATQLDALGPVEGSWNPA